MNSPKMKKIGLNEAYGDINGFLDKPFFPYRNYQRYNIEKFIHPLMLPLHWTARSQVKKVLKILEFLFFFFKFLYFPLISSVRSSWFLQRSS